MRRFFHHIFLGILLAALLAPVVEAFDIWDTTPGLAGDTEFNVAALAMVAGILSTVAIGAIRGFIRRFRPVSLFPAAQQKISRQMRPFPTFATVSPPWVPLRI